jgi:hypothetical protein
MITPPGRMHGFEDVHQDLALAEAVQHHAHRAELQATGRQPHEVRRDAVQLTEQHAQDLGARRRLDAEQPLDGQAVSELVEERGQVVRAGHVGDPLRPRPVLGVLLDARVQVADDGLALDDGLAVELQEQPQDPVRRGMLRPHVDDHRFFSKLAA